VGFTDRLKKVIKKSALKREDFAQYAEISRSQLFRYLKGEQDPGTVFYQSLKTNFPWINLDWLITGEGKLTLRKTIEQVKIKKNFIHLRLRKLIKEKLKITQTDFCKEVGITTGYLSMILSGKRGLSADALINIYVNYHEYFDWLITGEDTDLDIKLTKTEVLNSIEKQIEFKNELRERLIQLMASQRGLQSKLSKSIDKKPSYFSEIKRGSPVNAHHLRAVGIIFGADTVSDLLGISNKNQRPDTQASPQLNETFLDVGKQNLIKTFKNKERAEKIIKQLANIESLSEQVFQKLESHVNGVETTVNILIDKVEDQ
jgi:transcriptional regulator with XRE-family HTH domain